MRFFRCELFASAPSMSVQPGRVPIITFSVLLFFILCFSLSLSLFLHLVDCRVAFARFPCSRALASALIEECDDQTNERETNVFARGTKKNRDLARENCDRYYVATRKRIRSDVSVRIARIFRKWQMHVITVPVRWASIVCEIHAISRVIVEACPGDGLIAIRPAAVIASEYPKTSRQLTLPNVLLCYSSMCITYALCT